MIRLKKLATSDHDFMFNVMKQNMLRYHELYSLPWDEEWLAQNYLDKENLVVLFGGERAGIISLEFLEGRLHLHTVQLISGFQNGRIGLYILRELLQMMRQRGIQRVSCKVFKDHPARSMYERIGFKETTHESVFVSMEACLDGDLMRYVSRSPAF